MTKIKIGGQKYDLEELPESFRNRIESELDKEGIKYDKNDDKIKGEWNENKEPEERIKKIIGKKEKKTEKNTGKKEKKTEKNTGKKEKKTEKNTGMSLFRKMFGYP